MIPGVVHLSVDLRCRDGRPQALIFMDVHAHILTRYNTQHGKMQNAVRSVPSRLRACVFLVCLFCLVTNDGRLSTLELFLGSVHRYKRRKMYGLPVDVDNHRYL